MSRGRRVLPVTAGQHRYGRALSGPFRAIEVVPRNIIRPLETAVSRGLFIFSLRKVMPLRLMYSLCESDVLV